MLEHLKMYSVVEPSAIHRGYKLLWGASHKMKTLAPDGTGAHILRFPVQSYTTTPMVLWGWILLVPWAKGCCLESGGCEFKSHLVQEFWPQLNNSTLLLLRPKSFRLHLEYVAENFGKLRGQSFLRALYLLQFLFHKTVQYMTLSRTVASTARHASHFRIYSLFRHYLSKCWW